MLFRSLRTAKEIAAPKDGDSPGVGANETAIRELLKAAPERFDFITGENAQALGRHPSAVLWSLAEQVSQAPGRTRLTDSPPASLGGGRQGGESVSPPVGGLTSLGTTPGPVHQERTKGESSSKSTPGARPSRSSIDYAVLSGDGNHGREAREE